MTLSIRSALVRAIDSGRQYLPLRDAHTTLIRSDNDTDVVKVGPEVLLRDALYRMNEVFATQAAVVTANGQFMGWLTQDLLVALFQEDVDSALRSPCGDLLPVEQASVAAA